MSRDKKSMACMQLQEAVDSVHLISDTDYSRHSMVAIELPSNLGRTLQGWTPDGAIETPWSNTLTHTHTYTPQFKYSIVGNLPKVSFLYLHYLIRMNKYLLIQRKPSS